MYIKQFLDFLKEYKVFSLAIAFIMGGASTNLVNALVNNIVMPIMQPLMSSGWKEAILNIGPIQIMYGAFLAALINFLILALIVFFVTKILIKEDKKEGMAV